METPAETKGRYRLNERLSIACDASSALEVDLLCADARVAIELDGAQHLSDPDAYRRDRRKDQLLQENGYFVLRFLAEDVGKDLDRVLDTNSVRLERIENLDSRTSKVFDVPRYDDQIVTARCNVTILYRHRLSCCLQLLLQS